MENIKDANSSSEIALEKIVISAIQVPGVKVNRKKFLSEQFADKVDNLQEILEKGPLASNCSREMLGQIANKLILKRTSESSAVSFVAGLPGGLGMAATIPADVMQFFAMTLRLAQELSYLYDAEDLWQNGEIDDERVKNQLILYCGVMFGVSGAISGVRLLASQVAKTTLKKLPQKALTRTFWYPMVKQIGKAIGVKVTKANVAKGISKAIPIIGGVISGTLNFASMMPMGNKLAEALDKANFDYTEEEIIADYEIVLNASDEESATGEEKSGKPSIKNTLKRNINQATIGVSSIMSKLKKTPDSADEDDVFNTIEKLSKLKESGAITQEEFDSRKSELLSRI